MPKGNEHLPKVNTKLTAVSICANGKKVQLFLNLPVLNGKTVLPGNTLGNILDDSFPELERGDTFSIG